MTWRKWIVVILAIVAGVVAWRWLSRGPAEANATAETNVAVQAAVAPVERRNLSSSLTIAGEFKPFQEVDVHAKVAGYIRTIGVDVGDHVREGQTLAVLEVPELAAQLVGSNAAVGAAQQQIRKAQGDLQRAQSTHSAAHSAFTRLKQAADSRSGLVAQQEVDDAQAKDLEAEAQVSSTEAGLASAKQQLEVAQANQKEYTALSGYMHIVAPFDGVITKRYADTGALVAAGTSSSAQAIAVVRLAETSKLRLVLPVPESAAAQIRLGDPVEVRVQALNEDIEGKVSRFAASLDRETRTMETEIDFDNRNGRLMPGMYAETSLSTSTRKKALTVPLEAVSRNGDDAVVLVVNKQNIVEERHIKVGLVGNTRVEVLSGLSEHDRVVMGSQSQFQAGQRVIPTEIQVSGVSSEAGN
jgi:RND family efflux transporter MFP subunit